MTSTAIQVYKKKHVASDRFDLSKFQLDYQVKIWIPDGQKSRKYKRSYIKIWNSERSFDSLYKFKRYLRKNPQQHLIFNIIEHIEEKRSAVCGHNRVNDRHKNQFAQTPDTVYQYIQNHLQMQLSTFDPCPAKPTQNGLAIDWRADKHECIYINPPFKDSHEWIQKCISELDKQHFHTAVMMLPCRMSSPWFRLLCNRSECMLIPNKVTFKNYTHAYPWGVLLCVLRSTKPTKPCIIQSIDIHFQ